MNDETPTLFIVYNFFNLPESVFLVDPYTRTFCRGGTTSNVNCGELVRKLKREIAGLQVCGFGSSLNFEKSLFTALSIFCRDLTKTYDPMNYAGYITRNRVPVENTGMQAVIVQTGSQLLPDTFVVNTKTGDFWSGNIMATTFKELNMALIEDAKNTRLFWDHLENYPTLLKERFGESHVTVLKDEGGALSRFYTETDRFTRELQLKEINNKASKMTLAEFLERYDNKKGTK